MRIILASSSPRRAELLTAAGIPFDVHVVDVDEARRDGETADSCARRLALARLGDREEIEGDRSNELRIPADVNQGLRRER